MGGPSEITYGELKALLRQVLAAMMNLQAVPDNQLTQRFKLAREAAETLGHRDRFSKAPLAVSFSPDWSYELDDPFNHRHSRRFTNAHGQQQGTCIHLGNCDIGCDVRAKNTLDVNYIPRAEQHGAEVRPLHLVRAIEPGDAGYRVVFDRIHQGQLIRGEETAARVFIAAGSVGSTELLLRCRDEHKTLPNLSKALGGKWSANANVLSMATYADASRVQQTLGPDHFEPDRLHGWERERSAVCHRGRRLSECAPERLPGMRRSRCRDGGWTKCPSPNRRAPAWRRAVA